MFLKRTFLLTLKKICLEKFAYRAYLYCRLIKRFGITTYISFVFQNIFKDEVCITLPKIGTLYLRSKTADINAFLQTYCTSEAHWKDWIPCEPNIILDLGANIGMTTLLYKAKFPAAHIISLEPEKSNFTQLVKNTKPLKSVECVHAGVWSKSACLKVTSKGLPEGGYLGFRVEEVDCRKPETIQSLSILDIMRKSDITTIDLIKMDIEGSEGELFLNNYEWLKLTKVVFVEIHTWLISDIEDLIIKRARENDFKAIKASGNLFILLNKNLIEV